jgi:uncharacterized membrane protein
VSAIPKRFWVVLGVSVALNMFCVGLFVGRVVPLRQGRFAPAHQEQLDDVGPRAFMRHSGLRDAGPEVKQLLRARHERVKGSMHALSQSHERVRAALEAEPYDRERAAQAFRDTRELTTQMQTDMHDTLIDVAGKLGPAQRKRMAESLWNHHRPGP